MSEENNLSNSIQTYSVENISTLSGSNSYSIFYETGRDLYLNDMTADGVATERDNDFTIPVSILGQHTIIDVIKVAVVKDPNSRSFFEYGTPQIHGLSGGVIIPTYTGLDRYVYTLDIRNLPKSDRILRMGSTLKLVYVRQPNQTTPYHPWPFRTNGGKLVTHVIGEIMNETDNPVMVCRNCKSVEQHARNKHSCITCGTRYLDTSRDISLCQNCGRVYGHRDSPICPSCALHVQQTVCLSCGQHYFHGFGSGTDECPACHATMDFSNKIDYPFNDDSGDYGITYYEEVPITEYAMASTQGTTRSSVRVAKVMNADVELDTHFPSVNPPNIEELRNRAVLAATSSEETYYPEEAPTEYPADDLFTPYASPEGEPVGDDAENYPNTTYCGVDPDALGDDSGVGDNPDWSTPAGSGAGGGPPEEDDSEVSQPLPTGKVGFSSSTLTKDLAYLSGLTFQHITQRRIGSYNSPTEQIRDALQVCIINEQGYPRFSDFTSGDQGMPIDRSLTQPERLSKITIGADDESGIPFNTFCFEEILGNGTIIRYSSETGEPVAIKLPDCKWMSKEQWENDLKVIYYSGESSAPPLTEIEDHIAFSMRKRPGNIRQIWTRRDGLMDFEQTGQYSYAIRWYAPDDVGSYDSTNRKYNVRSGAVPVKTWSFAGTPYQYTVNQNEEKIHTETGNILTDDDLNYLYKMSITEQRGDLSFTQSWERPDANTVIHTKGTGGEAETTVTTTTATDPVSAEELKQAGLSIDAAYLKVGNTFTHEIEKTVTVPGLPGGTRTRTRRYSFGDVCVYEELGVGTNERTYVYYEYDTYRSSRTFGCKIAEYHSNGRYVEYDYDKNKRLICKTEPWVGTSEKITYNTYSNAPGDETRLVSVTERVGSQLVSKSLFSRAKRPGLLEEKVTRLYAGEKKLYRNVEVGYGQTADRYMMVPYNSYTWSHDESHAEWAGRIHKQAPLGGYLKYYEYAKLNEPGYSFRMSVIDKAHNGNLVNGQTIRTTYYYDDAQNVMRKREAVYLNFAFVDTNDERYTRDLSGKVIRTDYADGTFSTTTWICKGPLSETDRDGYTTTYHYNSAKRLSRISKSAVSFRYPGQSAVSSMPAEVTEYEFDAAGRTTGTTITTGGKTSTISLTLDALGRTISETDAAGLTTTYEYYLDGLTTVITTPTGATHFTQRHYNGDLEYEGGTGQQHFHYTYDYTTERGETLMCKTTWLYDEAAWRLLDKTYSTGSGKVVYHNRISPNGGFFHTITEYDTYGRVIWVGSDAREFPPVDYYYNPSLGITRQTAQPGTTLMNQVSETVNSYELKTMGGMHADAPAWLKSPQVWRKSEHKKYFRGDTIEPLVQTTWELVSQTTSGVGAATVMQDKYGNMTASWTEKKDGLHYQYSSVDMSDILDYSVEAGNKLIYQYSRTGTNLTFNYQWVSSGERTTITDGRGASVTNFVDLAGRQIMRSDGHGNSTTWEYDPVTGMMVRETNPLGEVTRYSYDIRGRVVSQYGSAVQPVRYVYDNAGRMSGMYTFRVPEGAVSTDPANRTDGDLTTWIYNPLSGTLVWKTYADGRTTSYTYNYSGLLVRKTTQNTEITYSYDEDSHLLLSVSYRDGTPGVTYNYDTRGMVSSITDASGTRTFTYNDKLDLVSETVPGDGGFVLNHKQTASGLNVGYQLTMGGNHVQNVLHYHDNTTRLAGIGVDREKPYTIDYLEGTAMLSEIKWPDGMKKAVQYDAQRAIPQTITYSRDGIGQIRHDSHTYDNAGRMLGRQSNNQRHAFGYNSRDEVISHSLNGTTIRQYNYDNIGNRITSMENTTLTQYDANNLNQYTLLSDSNGQEFTPAYDPEGNQLTARTSTGDWNITWNGENRPVCFTQGTRKITCTYDYMGRRTDKKEYRNNALINEKQFVYNDYQLIAENDNTESKIKTWVWNPLGGKSSTPLQMNIFDRREIENPIQETEYPSELEFPGNGYSAPFFSETSSDLYFNPGSSSYSQEPEPYEGYHATVYGHEEYENYRARIDRIKAATYRSYANLHPSLALQAHVNITNSSSLMTLCSWHDGYLDINLEEAFPNESERTFEGFFGVNIVVYVVDKYTLQRVGYPITVIHGGPDNYPFVQVSGELIPIAGSTPYPVDYPGNTYMGPFFESSDRDVLLYDTDSEPLSGSFISPTFYYEGDLFNGTARVDEYKAVSDHDYSSLHPGHELKAHVEFRRSGVNESFILPCRWHDGYFDVDLKAHIPNDESRILDYGHGFAMEMYVHDKYSQQKLHDYPLGLRWSTYSIFAHLTGELLSTVYPLDSSSSAESSSGVARMVALSSVPETSYPVSTWSGPFFETTYKDIILNDTTEYPQNGWSSSGHTFYYEDQLYVEDAYLEEHKMATIRDYGNLEPGHKLMAHVEFRRGSGTTSYKIPCEWRDGYAIVDYKTHIPNEADRLLGYRDGLATEIWLYNRYSGTMIGNVELFEDNGVVAHLTGEFASTDYPGSTEYPEDLPTKYPDNRWTGPYFSSGQNDIYLYDRTGSMRVTGCSHFTPYPQETLEDEERYLYDHLYVASEEDFTTHPAGYGIEAVIKKSECSEEPEVRVATTWSNGVFHVNLIDSVLTQDQRTYNYHELHIRFFLINKRTGHRIRQVNALMNSVNDMPIAHYTGQVITPSPFDGDFSDPAYNTDGIPKIRKTYYNYVTDHNKNVTSLVSSTGREYLAYSYDAFGNTLEQLSIQSEELNPFRFSSEYYDHQLGLVYYNYRHYNPKDGKWLSRDPIFERGGFNIYEFSGNNPVLYEDMLGLNVEKPSGTRRLIPMEGFLKVGGSIEFESTKVDSFAGHGPTKCSEYGEPNFEANRFSLKFNGIFQSESTYHVDGKPERLSYHSKKYKIVVHAVALKEPAFNTVINTLAGAISVAGFFKYNPKVQIGVALAGLLTTIVGSFGPKSKIISTKFSISVIITCECRVSDVTMILPGGGATQALVDSWRPIQNEEAKIEPYSPHETI